MKIENVHENVIVQGQKSTCTYKLVIEIINLDDEKKDYITFLNMEVFVLGMRRIYTYIIYSPLISDASDHLNLIYSSCLEND